jgi:hypothetical protein
LFEGRFFNDAIAVEAAVSVFLMSIESGMFGTVFAE